jgi:hypothetical protein
MSLKIKLEKRIKDKEAEVQSLEMQLREARIYVQAMQDMYRLLQKSNGDRYPSNGVSIRPGTILEQVITVLKQSGKSMKIMDILKALGKEANSQNRQSLVGSLNTYAKKNHFFVRTGPNTFGLLEWQHPDPEQYEENNLPDDFGI